MPKYKIQTIEDLIKILQEQTQNYNIYIASDEEHNQIFTKFYISVDTSNKALIIAGLSGTELEEN